MLEVERSMSSSSIRLQCLSLYPDGVIYTRMHNNGVWYSWCKTAPATNATTSAAGLMSAADKATVSSINSTWISGMARPRRI